MKTLICTCLFLVLSLLAFSQTCHEIQFDYDASGNRILREYVLVSCNNNNNQNMPHRKPNKSDSGSNLSMKIYPNPTVGLLNIDIASKDTTCSEPTLIYIYDANAQPIYATSTSTQYLKLDVSSLAQGTYIVKVICCNNQSSSVLLKISNTSGTQTTKKVTEVVK